MKTNTNVTFRLRTKKAVPARAWVGAAALLGTAVLLSGCHVDMWNQPKIKPYFESDFYADQQSNRPLIPHTVAIGAIQSDDPGYFTGYVARKPVPVIPVRAVKSFASPREMLLKGQDQFNAYCSPCHGRTGDGNGFIMQRGLGYWQKLAASYHTDRLRKVGDGYLYDTLVNGRGVMYGYGARIQDVNDRWAVVSYVRTLQLARLNSPTNVPALTPDAAAQATQDGTTTTAGPEMNANPDSPTHDTPTVSPLGTERPINRTPGGATREAQPRTANPVPGATQP